MVDLCKKRVIKHKAIHKIHVRYPRSGNLSLYTGEISGQAAERVVDVELLINRVLLYSAVAQAPFENSHRPGDGHLMESVSAFTQRS